MRGRRRGRPGRRRTKIAGKWTVVWSERASLPSELGRYRELTGGRNFYRTSRCRTFSLFMWFHAANSLYDDEVYGRRRNRWNEEILCTRWMREFQVEESSNLGFDENIRSVTDRSSKNASAWIFWRKPVSSICDEPFSMVSPFCSRDPETKISNEIIPKQPRKKYGKN